MKQILFLTGMFLFYFFSSAQEIDKNPLMWNQPVEMQSTQPVLKIYPKSLQKQKNYDRI